MRRDEQLLAPEVQAGLDALGADIRTMRLSDDATQCELGELAWMDQSTISRVERGLMPRLPLHRYARLRAAAEGRLGQVRRRDRRRGRRPTPDLD